MSTGVVLFLEVIGHDSLNHLIEQSFWAPLPWRHIGMELVVHHREDKSPAVPPFSIHTLLMACSQS